MNHWLDNEGFSRQNNRRVLRDQAKSGQVQHGRGSWKSTYSQLHHQGNLLFSPYPKEWINKRFSSGEDCNIHLASDNLCMIKVYKYRQRAADKEKDTIKIVNLRFRTLLVSYLVLNKKLSRHCRATHGSICESGGWNVGCLERMYAESKEPKEWPMMCTRPNLSNPTKFI